VYSKSATCVEVLFFDDAEDGKPSRVIPLDPRRNRSYHYWHVFVPGVEAGQVYGYRVHGPFDPEKGLRFDPEKLLLDPYGRAMAVPGIQPSGGERARRQHGSCHEECRG